MTKLSPAMRNMLDLLAHSADGCATHKNLRDFAGLTRRGARVVRERLIQVGYADRAPCDGNYLQITKAGRAAFEGVAP